MPAVLSAAFIWNAETLPDRCAWLHCDKQSCSSFVDSKKLCQVLAIENIEQFRKWHILTIDNILQKKKLERMKFWSNAYAVGDDDWIKIQLQQAGIKRMSIKNSKGISFARGENV